MTTFAWQTKPDAAGQIERLIAREAAKTRDDPDLASAYINPLVEGLAVIIATSVEGEPKAINVLADAVSHKLFVRASAHAPIIRRAPASDERRVA